MALSVKEKRKLLERDLPRQAQVRRTLLDYMQRAGLAPADMARRIGYSFQSLYLFLKGDYAHVASTSGPICAAILDFINAHPIEPLTESQGKLYETENVRLIRDQFYKALDGREARYFKGAPGSQKSFVLQHLIAELNRTELAKNGHGKRAFYVYCRSGITPSQLMKRVTESAGVPTVGEIDRLIKNLRFDLRGRTALFVFDEAQHLSVPCLETVRELHDMPPHCGLLFAGSHNIEETFNRLDMEQWASRLRKGTELPGVSEREAEQILRAELCDVSMEKMKALIRRCYATDLRKGREAKYISARLLFFAIQGIQERKARA